jgi:beta-glucosidase/6-phospho-beta-glucosidase/beta-galactosidase
MYSETNTLLSLFAADVAAADAFMQFQYAWIADPLYFGDYPALMRATQGTDLPTFTADQKRLLKETKNDFFAMNFYCGYYITAPPLGAPKNMVRNKLKKIKE